MDEFYVEHYAQAHVLNESAKRYSCCSGTDDECVYDSGSEHYAVYRRQSPMTTVGHIIPNMGTCLNWHAL